jgi:hypothetical protein
MIQLSFRQEWLGSNVSRRHRNPHNSAIFREDPAAGKFGAEHWHRHPTWDK